MIIFIGPSRSSTTRVLWQGFKKFIARGNVIDLAVGVVIGASFGAVVNALVRDFLTPLIGLIGGKPDFSNFALTVGSSKFGIGDFLNALISFLIISLVIYFFVVLPINKITAGSKKGPSTKKCPVCFTDIPTKARRCPNCTSDITVETVPKS